MGIPPRRAATDKNTDQNKDRPELWELPSIRSGGNACGDIVSAPGSSGPAPSNVPAGPRSEIGASPSSARESAEAPSGDRVATPRDILLALTYGLELVPHGAMLVASEGHLRVANRTATEILQKKDGIAMATTGLVADRASDTRLLHKLLARAIHSPELGEPEDSPLTLQRRKARHSLIVRVIPGPGLDCWPHA